jgi:lipopolysaccharide/colanic/teichoic acid biosynthesis glycosyltransferase
MKRTAIIALHDILILSLALPAAVLMHEHERFESERFWGLLVATPMLVAATLLAILILGPHRALWCRLGTAEIFALAQFVALAVTLFYVGQFLVDRFEALPWALPILQFMTAMLGLLGSRLAYIFLRRRMRRGAGGANAAPVLLVGAGDGAALLIELLHQRPGHGDPVGILCDRVPPTRSLSGVPVLGRLAQVDAALARLRVQDMPQPRIVITSPHHELGRTAVYELIARVDAAGFRVEQLPDVLQLMDEPGPRPDATNDGASGSTAVEGLTRKRVFDAGVAAVALLALSPLLALTAVVVAVGIRRPVLFVQIRPGRNRRPYKLLKFRTMRDPTDAAGRPLSDAARTPWAGRLLRRLRVDELPQLWNVVVGDMSLIGPRPLLAGDLDTMPDGGRARLVVRPGITGWAQVNGGHQLTADEKLVLDLWYAANADLKLDLLIAWRTVLMVVFGERRQPAVIAHARASLASRQLALAK